MNRAAVPEKKTQQRPAFHDNDGRRIHFRRSARIQNRVSNGKTAHASTKPTRRSRQSSCFQTNVSLGLWRTLDSPRMSAGKSERIGCRMIGTKRPEVLARLPQNRCIQMSALKRRCRGSRISGGTLAVRTIAGAWRRRQSRRRVVHVLSIVLHRFSLPGMLQPIATATDRRRGRKETRKNSEQ